MIFFIFKKTYCKFAHTKKYCKHLYQLSPYHATDLHVRSSIRTYGRDNVYLHQWEGYYLLQNKTQMSKVIKDFIL